MISPTLLMETELDTESEPESDETGNIYEEVLNWGNCQHGQHVRWHSTTLSNCNWGRRDSDISYYQKVGTQIIFDHSLSFMFQHFPSESNTVIPKEKSKLSRTTKSIPKSNTVIKIDNYVDSWHKIEHARGKEERQFKGLKKTLSEKLSSLRFYQSRKIFGCQNHKYK